MNSENQVRYKDEGNFFASHFTYFTYYHFSPLFPLEPLQKCLWNDVAAVGWKKICQTEDVIFKTRIKLYKTWYLMLRMTS